MKLRKSEWGLIRAALLAMHAGEVQCRLGNRQDVKRGRWVIHEGLRDMDRQSVLLMKRIERLLKKLRGKPL